MKAARVGRLPELDVFRGLTVALMGLTHGLFWTFLHTAWIDALARTGSFCCYPGFLLAFGMSLGISVERGRAVGLEGRKRLLRQARTLLLAFYVIAFARYLPALMSGGWAHRITRLALLLTLQDAPKAGNFFLSFAIYLVMAAWLAGRLCAWSRQGAGLLFAALLLSASGMVLSRMAVPGMIAHSWAAPYWRLLFGASAASRAFPVLPYLPLLIMGMLTGRAYLLTDDRRRWRTRIALVSGCISVLTWVSCGKIAPSSPWSARCYDPTPGPMYLLCAGAVALHTFALCGMATARFNTHWARHVQTYLRFVGSCSIEMVVAQYGWISLWFLGLSYAGRHWGLGPNNAERTLFFLITMLTVPPCLVYAWHKVTLSVLQWGCCNPLPV